MSYFGSGSYFSSPSSLPWSSLIPFHLPPLFEDYQSQGKNHLSGGTGAVMKNFFTGSGTGAEAQ